MFTRNFYKKSSLAFKYSNAIGNIMKLTQAEKDEIIADFKEWSGGFTPDECPARGFDEATHESFVEHALDSKFTSRAEVVEEFLNDYEA